MAERIYWNDGWKFCGSFEKESVSPEFDDNSWEEVRIPHTCVETPLHYFDEEIYQMESCYRKKFYAPEEWRGKKVLLTIDGAAHDSEVFLNGEKIGEHHCGYTAFTTDLGEALVYGAENVLVVKVDSRENLNIPPFGYVIDYMTYGGIYRDVYVEIQNPSYIEDVFVRSKFRGRNEVDLLSEISIEGDIKGILVRQSIRKEGEEEYQLLGEKKAEEILAKEQPESGHKIRMKFSSVKVERWDVDSPVLYEIKTEICSQDGEREEKDVKVGFREAVFRTDGFWLNGRKLKIRGLNRHQCYPYVGYAMPESMQRRDAAILKKELGLNAVRTSHYPQSHYFLDQCDRLGLLVFTEIPGWQHIGDESWKAQAVENVKDMVVQYRNHPSIILWGVRINESRDDDEFYRATNKAAHELDPSRQTGGVRALKKSNLLEDVYTYNDFCHDGGKLSCEKKKNVTSNMSKPYLISEYNGHMYPTKVFDWEEHRAEQARRHANVLDAAAGEDDIAGTFGWCMFDYNTHKDFGSGDRICYHGVMDMFRNPKLAASVYAVEGEEPVLEISSTMDIGEHPGGNLGNIWIHTNADSVKMYKNNRFVKEYKTEDSQWKNLKHGPILIDDFIGNAIRKEKRFQPRDADKIAEILNASARYGVYHIPKKLMLAMPKLMLKYKLKPIDAVDLYTKYIGDWGGTSTSYRFEAVKDGKTVKTSVKEPVMSLHLEVDADHTDLEEKTSYDVAAVRLRVLDQNGNVVNFFNEPVQFETKGDIELIGPSVIALSGGMGGTFVKTTGKSGKGRLVIRTAQMETYETEFECKCGEEIL